MHLKFLRHGRGSARGAAAYLLAERSHNGELREAVTVLRGDPEQVAAVADSLEFKLRYRSAVIAWAPEDRPTPAQIEQTLDEFEATAWAGVGQDRYAWTAVQHDEPGGGVHVHILTARVDLTTGKSLNIAPPGWEQTFDHLRDALNWENGWARPDDPARARLLQPGHEAHRPAGKVEINAYVAARIEAGEIHNRADIVAALHEVGLETPRRGKNYITALDPDTGQKWRLKGHIYERDWSVERTLEAASGAEQTAGGKLDSERARAAFEQLQEARAKRAEYNRQRYGAAEQSNVAEHVRAREQSQDAAKTPDSGRCWAVEPLGSWLERHLGPDSIFITAGKSRTRRTGKGQENETTASGLGARAIRSERGEVHSPSGGHEGQRWLDVEGRSDRREIGGVDHDRTRAKAYRIAHNAIQRAEELVRTAATANHGLATATRQAAAANRAAERVRDAMDRELEEFKRRNLVAVAMQHGYEIDRKRSTASAVAMIGPGDHKIVVGQAEDGHGVYYSLRGGSERAGSVVDFVQERLEASGQPSTLGHVRKSLRGPLRASEGHARGATLPRPQPTTKDRLGVIAQIEAAPETTQHKYLAARGLDYELQNSPRFRGTVRRDERGNALFPHQDRAGWCGGEIKNQGFTGQPKGGSKGLWLSNMSEQDTRLVICESAIDCLSYHAIHGDEHTRYASFGGSMSPEQKDLVKGLVAKAQGKGLAVVVATDNDEQGAQYVDLIRDELASSGQIEEHRPEHCKDWNEELQERQRLMQEEREAQETRELFKAEELQQEQDRGLEL